MKWLFISIGAVLLLGGGFLAWFLLSGETVREVNARYAPKFEPIKAKFREIAAALPPKGSITTRKTAGALTPAPVFHKEDRAANNTELLVYEQLLDPSVDLKAKKEFDLIFTGDIVFALRQINPPAGAGFMNPDQRASSAVIANYERGLATRYLAVARPVHYVAPRALDKKTFFPGRLDVELFLVDLNTRDILAWDRIEAKTAATTSAYFRPGHDDLKEVEQSAHSTMWVEAVDKIGASLREISGGTFVLK
jgi:hypothetical protein